MKNRTKKKLKKQHLLNIRIIRNDHIPAFGAWLDYPDERFENYILLNLRANMGAWFDEDGKLVASTTPECWRTLIETLMHEFGHALEKYFRQQYSEDDMHRITESYQARLVEEFGEPS